MSEEHYKDKSERLQQANDELHRSLYRVRMAWLKMHDPYAAPELQAEARALLTSILGGAEDVHWHTKALDEMRLERDDLRKKIAQIRALQRWDLVSAEYHGGWDSERNMQRAQDGDYVAADEIDAILGERNNA